MAHFAEIDSDNFVTRVLVIDDSQESRGQDFLAHNLGLGGTWIQTSYNTRGGTHIAGGIPLRKNFAGVGYTYDATKDVFIPPKIFSSWVLNENTGCWNAPVSYPTDGKNYMWNETSGSWVVI